MSLSSGCQFSFANMHTRKLIHPCVCFYRQPTIAWQRHDNVFLCFSNLNLYFPLCPLRQRPQNIQIINFTAFNTSLFTQTRYKDNTYMNKLTSTRLPSWKTMYLILNQHKKYDQVSYKKSCTFRLINWNTKSYRNMQKII